MALNHTHITIGCGFILMMLVSSCGPKEAAFTIDESYTLGANDNKPLGGSLFYKLSKKSFVSAEHAFNRRNFDEWYGNMPYATDIQRLYLLVSPAVNTMAEEAEAMADFVKSGNILFVATDYVPEHWKEYFGISINQFYPGNTIPRRPVLQDTYRSVKDSLRRDNRSFGYFYRPFNNHLSIAPYRTTYPLGLNYYGQPDMAIIRIGKGWMFFCTNAAALSNYFLLTNHNLDFALTLYSYLPSYPTYVIWDDFYNKNIRRPEPKQSVFQAMLAIQPLRWALTLACVLAAIWVLTNLRRRQRMIPVLEPNLNSSIAFAETISRLYLNKNDHRPIARKLSNYFLETIRQRNYSLSEHADLESMLRSKNNLSLGEAKNLAALIFRAHADDKLSDYDLLQMNAYIQKAMQA